MNKYINYLICFVLLINSLSGISIDSDEKRQVEILSSALDSFGTDEAKNIWPGFRLNESPAVVHFKSGNIYSFYLRSSPQWQNLSFGQKNVTFSSHDHWGVTKIMMHPGFSIDGQQSFIFSWGKDVEKSTYNLSLLTFIHERFHLHQFGHFIKHEKGAHYSEEWNEKNQILIGIENWLLTEFLMEKDQSTTREEWLKDYIAVNTIRVKLLKAPSIQWEDLQQQMEGMADYVSLRTFEIFPLIESFSMEEAILHLREKKTGRDYSFVNDAVKGRHYFIGSTLGFALDLYGADWKSQVEGGIALRTLLKQALPMSQEEMRSRFDRLKRSSNYKEIAADIKQGVAKEKSELDKVLHSYENSEGLTVHLGRPKSSLSGGGKKQGHYSLGKRATLTTGETSFASSSDQLWRLKFTDIPFVLEDKGGGKSFKIGEEAIIMIDQEEIFINELDENPKSFSKVSLEDDHCEFFAELPGHIYSDQGVVKIKFHK